jgi:hypothetical protein
MKNESVNRIKGLMENEKYIEKKVNALSIYNVYWCLHELGWRGKLLEGRVLKNDSFCKLQLCTRQKNHPHPIFIGLGVKKLTNCRNTVLSLLKNTK